MPGVVEGPHESGIVTAREGAMVPDETAQAVGCPLPKTQVEAELHVGVNFLPLACDGVKLEALEGKQKCARPSLNFDRLRAGIYSVTRRIWANIAWKRLTS